MTTLQLPLTHTPSYGLLSLALFKNAPVQWFDANELSEPKYGTVTGVEAIRAELEKGLPGKEVSSPLWFLTKLSNDDEVPLPPMPTLFESNTPFPDVQKVLDAFDDYLAYRYESSRQSYRVC